MYNKDGHAILRGVQQNIKCERVTRLTLNSSVNTYGLLAVVGSTRVVLPLILGKDESLRGEHLLKLLAKFGLPAIQDNAGKPVKPTDRFSADMLRIQTFIVPSSTPAKPVPGTILGQDALRAAGKGVIPLKLRPGEPLTVAHAYEGLHNGLRLAGTLYTKDGAALLRGAASTDVLDSVAFLLDMRRETSGARVRLGDEVFVMPMSVGVGEPLTGTHVRLLLDAFAFTMIRHPNGRPVHESDPITVRYLEQSTFLMERTPTDGMREAAEVLRKAGGIGGCRKRKFSRKSKRTRRSRRSTRSKRARRTKR